MNREWISYEIVLGKVCLSTLVLLIGHTAPVTATLLPLPVCHQAVLPLCRVEHLMLPDFIIEVCISLSQHDAQGRSSCLSGQQGTTVAIMLVQDPAASLSNQLLLFNRGWCYFYQKNCERASSSLCWLSSFSVDNWLACCFFPVPDRAGKHRGDTGHVVRDGGHLPVSSHGHGGCTGVCQLPQLQRDWSREEHVIRRADEAMPPTGWALVLYRQKWDEMWNPPRPNVILTGFPLTCLCPPVCCVAVRNCLECRQRQRDRNCKSSLTSSKSQDSLHSASTTSKVPHTWIRNTYRAHLQDLTHKYAYVWHTTSDVLSSILSRIQTDSCRM